MSHEAERPVTHAGESRDPSLARELEAIPYEPLFRLRKS